MDVRSAPEGIRHPWHEAPEAGTVVEVAPGILWTRLPLPMRLDHVNVYVLDDGPCWIVIDTGLDWKGCRDAWEALLAGPLAGKPAGRVILTHHHPDHIGLAGWFAERGAEVAVVGVHPLSGGLFVAAEQGVETAVDPQEQDRQSRGDERKVDLHLRRGPVAI